MLKVYQSNKVERLLSKLVTLLLEQDTSPLQQEIIVVENPGLAHWLKMQLAHSLGIAANIEFPMPSRFFWQIQRQLIPDLAQDSVFNKTSLTWLVMECLQDDALLSQPDYQLLKNFLNEETTDSERDLRTYRLASTIADLYDQYLVYRPDWIEAWQNQDWRIGDEALAEHTWQGMLWCELLKRVAQKQLPDRHRASMVNDFMSALDEANEQDLPKRVIFFGFTTLPKHQIDALQLLSHKMEVHLLTPNPCEYYWGDVVSEQDQARLRSRNIPLPLVDAGNDLLASLGQLGKDFQRLLLDIADDIQEESLFLENDGDSLLQQIQNQILHLQNPQAPLVPEALDESIQIVGCHSAMREVEVLHDYLLNVFESNHIAPQDVVVMIPDVASYAPFIDAVFNKQAGSMTIPYSISDRPIQAEHPLLNGVSLLLGLPQSRMGLREVITLLEIPAVHRAYGLAEAHIPRLKQWLMDAGVRWGFDENSRAALGLPEWQQNTWIYGIRRLLMGYAVQSNERIHDIVPVANIEGLDAQLLGPLILFVEHLHDFSEAMQVAKTAEEWSPFLHDWVHQFFQADEYELTLLEHVFSAVEEWVQSSQMVHYCEKLDHKVMADGINSRLQKANGSQHFMVGKVNFCTLLPMRSIPFKVVAVLGLNDSEYPRSVIPNSLDLMRFKHRLGDRSRRNEDRYLFLEAIVSAREALYLSYKSKSQNNDEPLTPSVVLAEFMDYLSPTSQALLQQHPLQPFNPKYFASGSGFYSYNKDWLGAIADQSPIDKKPTFTPITEQQQDDVTIEQLIQFFQNPCRYFLNHRLDISLFQSFDEEDDHEPFIMDGLTQYQLKQHMMQDVLQGHVMRKDSAEGQLAFGEIGDQHWRNMQQQLQPMVEAYAEYEVYSRSLPIEINVHFDADMPRIVGWQYQVYEQFHLMFVPSRFKTRHLLQLMLEQAGLSAMGQQKHSRLICQDKIISLKPMKMEQAQTYLNTLLEYYLSGLQSPLAFLPDTAWQFIEPLKKGARKTPEDKAISAFIGTDNSFGFGKAGEREDLHVIRCLGELTEIPPVTVDVAQHVFDVWVSEDLYEENSL